MRPSILTLAVLTLVLLTGMVYGQGTPPVPGDQGSVPPVPPSPSVQPEHEQAPAANAAPTTPGPQLMEFQKHFEQWKKYLTQLQGLRAEYVSASKEDKEQLKAKYEKLVAEASALQPKLIESAEKAYMENPKADVQLQQFLFVAAVDNYQIENFEEAYRLVKLLVDHGEKKPEIELVGGVCAYCIGKLDDAEMLLKDALKQGVPLQTLDGKKSLDAMASNFLSEPSTYKKAWAKEQEIRDKEAKANDLPRVLLKTTAGDIVIELFENEAPNTVANFISLVESGFYDGLTFHRVLEAFMAQGGCPDGTGGGGPGYQIPCECYRPDTRKHFRGSLSMAHAGKDTGGSQFFLTFVPTSFLDGKHTVFGRVVEGMENLSKIQKRDPNKPKAALGPPDKIIKATVVRKRDHEYKPKKTGE